jgi:hypothetical protein
MTPHHHPPYNHHSNKHDVNNNEPTTTSTTNISNREGTDDTLPMMAFYEDWWRTYQSQSSSVPSRPPPPPPASSGSSSSSSSHIIRDPTSQQPQQLFVQWLSPYWSTQLEFHSLLNWNRTGHPYNSSSSAHCTRPNATTTYDHTNVTTSGRTTTTSRRRIGTTNPPPPEDHPHRIVNTAILQQLYRQYYDHHRSAVLNIDEDDHDNGTTTDATVTTVNAASSPVASVVTSHDYGTSLSLSSVEEFFQEYPDCCTAPQPPPPRRYGRYTDDDSSRTASSNGVEEEEEDHGQQHVIVGSGNDPIEVDDDDDDDNNPWVVSLPSSTHNNNNNHTKKKMSTQQQPQHDRSQWNERSVTAITDTTTTTASTKHIPALDNGTTTQRISPTSIIMEPRPPSTHVVANNSAPCVGSTSSNNGNPHLNPYHRMDRNRNTNHVPQREEGMVPPPPPKPHVPPPPQQHPTSFSSSSWDDYYGPTTSIHNPFQTAREVAAAHPTTIPRRQPSYHHSEYDDQSIPTNDGLYNDHICTTSNIPYDDRHHRNQSTNQQYVPHMWQATSANTTMVGHSDPSTKMNPYHPIPHQQQQLHHPPPPPVPVIRESLKRKFQPPIKRDSNHHHHPTTAVDAQPTTTDSAPNNASTSRTRMGGSIQTVITRRPQSQPPKMPATAASKTNSHNCSDTADTTSDELPEELQIYGKELVMKIENEIMDQTTTEDPITFHDIAGLHDQKQTVYEIVCWPMQRPDLFTGLRRAPNGLLLYGPPGTGKISVVPPFLLFLSYCHFLTNL